MLQKQDWCVATISLVRNEEEDALLRESLTCLAAFGVPVFVTDGGSPESFLSFVKSLPNTTLLTMPAKGLFAQVKSSLLGAAATAAPFLLYTEPDKKNFFANGLPNFLLKASPMENTGIVMASRNEAAFASFPHFQRTTETTINCCCEEVVGLKTDYCYGPFLLNKKLVETTVAAKEDMGWGWRPFAFATAHRLGYEVQSIEGDFFCPEAQREDDAAERIYRMKQLEQNIRGLVLAASEKRQG